MNSVGLWKKCWKQKGASDCREKTCYRLWDMGGVASIHSSKGSGSDLLGVSLEGSQIFCTLGEERRANSEEP